MTTNIQQRGIPSFIMEEVVIGGDLAQLTPEQRVKYYSTVCSSLGLNPFTTPFAYIKLGGKLTLYAKRDATDQLRHIHNVNIEIVAREWQNDLYIVTTRATTDGRQDESVGAVQVGNLKGEALANAIMKAETKAKRRVTLSICGLGWLDETEVDTISGASIVGFNPRTGEISETTPTQPPPLLTAPPDGAPPDTHPWLISCPNHNIPWFQTERMKAPAHQLDDNSWCNQATVLNPIIDDLLLECTHLFPSRSRLTEWLKGKFGGRTWSILTCREKLSAIETLTNMPPPQPVPPTVDALATPIEV